MKTVTETAGREEGCVGEETSTVEFICGSIISASRRVPSSLKRHIL